MHVNQKPRRRHSEQFKAQVLAACAEPGASVSAVALSFGLNDNLVHQWRRGRGVNACSRISRSRSHSQPPVSRLSTQPAAANETKSAVASAFRRKFLGYELWVAPGGVVKRGVASKPMATFKQRIRQLTRRSGGCSMGAVVQRLCLYVLGWKAYFGLSQTPKVWRGLDEWLRHRMRAIQLKQWKRGTTMYRELRSLGASPGVAQRVAANSRRWWRNSGKLLNSVLTISHFDRLGLPRLS